MNAIYRSAECVAIWLGESADDSGFIMDKMMEWKAGFDRISLSCNNTSYDYLISIMLSTNSVFNGLSDPDKGHTWRALDLLLQRPWWRRAWVVQEATLIGATRTFFFCGHCMANWECFRTTFQRIRTLCIRQYHSRFPSGGQITVLLPFKVYQDG